MTLSRLPEAVRPAHYDLSIVTNTKEESFSGTVLIQANVQEKVESISLNSQVTVTEASVKGREVPFSQENGVLSLTAASDQGDTEIKLKFTSKIGNGMAGFYKSRDGIWSTHFEPSDARKAFPCFDQPDMKATFKLRITAPASLTVLSNTTVVDEFEAPDIAQDPDSGKMKTTVFDITPKMSTYLVAFVVGPLEYIENERLRVYASKGRSRHGAFALDIGKQCLSFFERYFDIPYPLKKLDMVSVPEFAMGAMENWGLVTFRASSLLFTEESNPNMKKNIAETVCHELAHQWFGNLVTMNWWNDLWLNEGFATWASILAIKHTDLKWEVQPSFVSECIGGLEHDALLATHPIETDNDPNQIFDPISYSKGAALIQMTEDFRGEDFRKGLSRYLKEKAYKNATSRELCAYINADIDTWVKKSGYPLLTLHKDNKISQKRFTLLDEDTEGVVWNVPVKIDWLNGETEYVELRGPSVQISAKTELFKINAGQVGFYRVRYEDSELPFRLLEHGLGTVDRLGIYSDLHAQTLSCGQKISEYFRILPFAKQEPNFDAYAEVTAAMEEMKSIFYDRKEHFEKLILEIARVDFGFERVDDINEMSMRSTKTREAVVNGNEDVIARILHEDVDPAFRASRFIAMAKSDEGAFDRLIEIYKGSAIPDEKNSALMACGHSAKGALSLIPQLGTEIVPQDAHYLFIGIASNYELREELVDTVIEKWGFLRELFKDSGSILSFITERVFSVTPSAKQERVLAFLQSADTRGVEMAVENAKETMKIYRRVREFNKDLFK